MKAKKVRNVVAGIAAVGSIGLLILLANSHNEKYSKQWFASLSNDEFDMEREKVRQAFCSAGKDFSLAVRLENILHLFDSFDKDNGDWVWNVRKEFSFPKHREHGWYLPNDD